MIVATFHAFRGPSEPVKEGVLAVGRWKMIKERAAGLTRARCGIEDLHRSQPGFTSTSRVSRASRITEHTPRPSPRRQDDASMTNSQAPGARALPEEITAYR